MISREIVSTTRWVALKISNPTILSQSALMLIFLLMLAAGGLNAQGTTAEFLGTVTDTDGKAVPRALLALENTNTHEHQSVTSSSTGEFAITGSLQRAGDCAGLSKDNAGGNTLDRGRPATAKYCAKARSGIADGRSNS